MANPRGERKRICKDEELECSNRLGISSDYLCSSSLSVSNSALLMKTFEGLPLMPYMLSNKVLPRKIKFQNFDGRYGVLLVQVLVVESDKFNNPLAEPWAKLVHLVQQSCGYSHIIATANSFGKYVMPRAAALLDVSPITDVTEISYTNTCVRLLTIQCDGLVLLIAYLILFGSLMRELNYYRYNL
ncbi:hypothetical protein Fmac_001370 [Flemingia macrophylla]|uniref:Electron transfer flavoprotein alpha/beta-subunit N-terminal domain-containing protein n=1 Tax=Flemingia macrophylla TaxID=520843 RepID=A0ABD1NGW5_9FABA